MCYINTSSLVELHFKKSSPIFRRKTFAHTIMGESFTPQLFVSTSIDISPRHIHNICICVCNINFFFLSYFSLAFKFPFSFSGFFPTYCAGTRFSILFLPPLSSNIFTHTRVRARNFCKQVCPPVTLGGNPV